ncbi:MAG: indole-3-glycerol phosphate synthase TrpC [Acidobacteriota bacterium]
MSDRQSILQEIVASRREAIAQVSSDDIPTVPLRAKRLDNPFVNALEDQRGNAIIAEVKMGSPKLGSLEGRFDPLRQAEIYAENGAAALSVVVEPEYFHGSYELLTKCANVSGLPTIAKDFIIDEMQLQWAAEAGANAVLLIASLLSRNELQTFAESAALLGLVPLIETHSEEDIAKLAYSDWEIVGINNRDLSTFEVDLERSARLAATLPQETLKVAESGIGSRADVETLAAAGFDAYLIGESLLLAEDPAAQLRRLLGRG